MRKLVLTASLAVFFSLLISGCYTQFSGPEPKTGERYQYNYSYGYYDDPYYWGSFCYPSFFGYPYYNYGFFYYPWYYDPGYYYNDGPTSSRKFIRNRDRDNIPPPPSGGGVITPPPSPPPAPSPSSGDVKHRSGGDSGQKSDNSGRQQKSDNSGGKSTRGRR